MMRADCGRLSAMLLVLGAQLLHAGAERRFSLTHTPSTLTLTTQDTVIWSHTVDEPVLYVGSGETRFSEVYGNFDVVERLDEKLPLREVRVVEEGEVTQLTFYSGDVQLGMVLRTTETHEVVMEWGGLPVGYDRVWIRIHAEPDEHVYGAGEQFSSLDLRGRAYPIWTREQGVGRNASEPLKALLDVAAHAGGDYHTTYFPQSSFISSRHYSCHVDGHNYLTLDFSHPTHHEVSILGEPPSIMFNVEESMLDVTRALTMHLGTQPPLPEWLHDGTVLGVQGGTKQMLDVLRRAQESGVRVSGLWIQDWSGKIVTSFGKRVYWDWVWDESWYPGLDVEIRRLREQGVRLFAYINAHVHTGGTLFRYADQHGYLMRNASGQSYRQDYMEFECGTVDPTNPDAVAWYKGVIRRNLIEFGFGGWMADFGEYIPVDGVFHDGRDGLAMHNQFPVLWAQINREAVEEAGRLGDVVFYMRAGAAGTQKYTTLMWAGDQNVDWTYSDGLGSTLPAALSLAMSGVGLTHFDIGGYTSLVVPGRQYDSVSLTVNLTRSHELFFRSAEYAVFTPVMRTHEGNLPQFNFQVYGEAGWLARYGRLVSQYVRLKPYRRALEAELWTEGTPVQRPLFLHYPREAAAYTQPYQYLLGADVLVAPVCEAGVGEWDVYLPDDAWTHMYTGERYHGPTRMRVSAPLGSPPVFYRDHSAWADLFSQLRDIAGTGTCERGGPCP